jgi:myo-inositol-1(or 4)-monophosphatase
MSTPDQAIIAFAHSLADAAGEVIRPYFRQTIEVVDKSNGTKRFDPVTEADRKAESTIRTLIKARFPHDGILGEEHGNEPGTSGRTWILDPIDGTRAFITGRHTWGTLIALSEGGVPVLGVIDQPILRERFVGYPGTAELVAPETRRVLRTRACHSLGAAVVSTTHPWGYFDARERDLFERICAQARLSYFGGDCYAYGLLAMGFIDLIVEAALNPWDVAALIPVIENAGGVISDWQGGPCPQGGRVVAAGDSRLHAEALQILAQNTPSP